MNPALLDLDLEQSYLVDICITDEEGRMIREVMHEQLTAGHHTIQLDISGLASGLYFAMINTGNENKMVRLNIAK